MEKEIFLPKGSDQRFKAQMKMHIFSIILMFDLMQMLKVSIAMIIKSIVEMVTGDNIFNVLSGIEGIGDVLAIYGFNGINIESFKFIGVISNVITYGGAIITIGIAILLIWLMKKQIEIYLEDPSTNYGEIITVKKGAYVWLGFLLGMYGGHLFVLKKKKRAIIFLIMGLFSAEFPILMYYTLGISFADAFLGCYLEKDNKGCIDVEDYPYII